MVDALRLADVAVGFRNRSVVRRVSCAVPEGGLACLLGQSGSGKTTLLRAIAGFEPVMAGEIHIFGEVVASPGHSIAPQKRNVGMVFQEYALFPHLTVRENIAFGLSAQRGRERQARVASLAAMLSIGDLLERYPHQLSGGQQQRVALARALAPRPQILLLDEPFANLDVALREQIAREVRGVLRQDGITAILVSHHQLEAFALADEIGILSHSTLVQWATPYNIYHRPACACVAREIGEGVLVPGTVRGAELVEISLGLVSGALPPGFAVGQTVWVLLRPDDIVHDDTSATTALVVEKAFRGAEFLYTLRLADGYQVLSLVPSHHNHRLNEPIGIRLEIDHLVIFREDSCPTLPEHTLPSPELSGDPAPSPDPLPSPHDPTPCSP
jgi:iron(III) transport system ATP-binding protein